MKPYRDLLFILILAIASLIWSLMIPDLNIYPLNLPPLALFVLFLPGYALLAALKASIYRNNLWIRAVYSVNLSILITILLIILSIPLNSNDIPLRILLFSVTIIFTPIAFIRRNLVETETEPSTTPVKESDIVTFPESMEGIAIRVENVGMEFNLSQEKVDNIKEYFIKLVKGELLYQEFWALKNVSFQVKKGEKLGIIGLNGAGKSTLLKLISGVMKPTEGKIKVNGGVVPLLELGGGFDSNYTGRENIFLRGALLGYSKSFMERKFDEIVEFAELEEFIDVPLKNYSSGMISRLGFSLSTMVLPEILILDEVFSTGDIKFQKKSEERMNSLLSKDTTVLLVSHSMAQVKKLCTHAIWLDKGRLVMEGPVDEVIAEYEKSIRK